jgi:hypothetical protein
MTHRMVRKKKQENKPSEINRKLIIKWKCFGILTYFNEHFGEIANIKNVYMDKTRKQTYHLCTIAIVQTTEQLINDLFRKNY